MEYFGFFSFIMVLFLMGKVNRLERILRDNGLGSVRAAGLGEQMRKQVGNTVTLTVEDTRSSLSAGTGRVTSSHLSSI